MCNTHSKLRGKVVEVFGTLSRLSEESGIPLSTLSRKFNGKLSWTQKDIRLISALLRIDKAEIGFYFFQFYSQKNLTKYYKIAKETKYG